MKSSVPIAAALLSFVASVASSAISSSVFASPSTVGTTIEGPFPSSQAITTSVAGSVALPSAQPSSGVAFPSALPSSSVSLSIGATQTVTIPGDCVCPSGSSTSGVPSVSNIATTVTLSSFTTSLGGGATTVTVPAPSTFGGTGTAITSTFNGGTQTPVTVTSFISYATGTPVAAITSYIAGGTPVSAVTSYFATATPAVTSFFSTATAAPVPATSSSYGTTTVTVVSSSAGCSCPQPSSSAADPQKLKDTSSAMSHGVRAEGVLAVAVAGVLAALI